MQLTAIPPEADITMSFFDDSFQTWVLLEEVSNVFIMAAPLSLSCSHTRVDPQLDQLPDKSRVQVTWRVSGKEWGERMEWRQRAQSAHSGEKEEGEHHDREGGGKEGGDSIDRGSNDGDSDDGKRAGASSNAAESGRGETAVAVEEHASTEE